jgi:phospholipid transport system substrate-binding protein
MKTLLTASLVLFVFFAQHVVAETPTKALEVAVDKILKVASDKQLTEENKKKALADVLKTEIDFENLSKRVVSKEWNSATDAQKDEFKALFLNVMVDTYSTLLSNYSGEKVEFEQEQVKANKYAIVDTVIVSDGNKRIPVRYRLINEGSGWKVYDFIPEGVSFVSSYKNNYARVIRSDGLAGLLVEMKKPKSE